MTHGKSYPISLKSATDNRTNHSAQRLRSKGSSGAHEPLSRGKLGLFVIIIIVIILSICIVRAYFMLNISNQTIL